MLIELNTLLSPGNWEFVHFPPFPVTVTDSCASACLLQSLHPMQLFAIKGVTFIDSAG